MITLTVEIYSNTDGYYQIIDLVKASLGFPTILENLRAVGLSFMSATAITDLSGLISTQHEYRAQFEANFQFALEYTDYPGIIEDVVVEENFNNGQIVRNFTVDT